nr:uncharacterized protein LOC128704044 [Cherax quadricarinatus]XP_053654976.1 uncharacterized protein LOC128704044 [Cherax quadricarinatus]XP_053654977.1 uncharacterized protein LOC128704044 [Cherax quadricarinatus]XP_053654978.1 uncharacterized protein LOC128704044 [Cherax quadricarinatus]XP_053654979.1 uncharacterized protein LOC128704044 [Cherax quadricarinatus]
MIMLSVDTTVQLLWVGTSAAAVVSGVCVLAAISGNSWLTSEERIPNPAYRNGSSRVEHLSKYTVSGLFTLCTTEVGKTEFICTRIDYFPSEMYTPDPQDSTTAILYAVLKSAGYLVTAVVVLLVAEVLCIIALCSSRRPALIFLAGVTFILAGLVMMVGVVMYIATLKGEVGDKLKARSIFQLPRFSYSYGWCFLLLMPAFLATETAGMTSIFLYIYWYKREWHRKCVPGVWGGHFPHHHHAPRPLTARAPPTPTSSRCSGERYIVEYVAVDHHPDTLHHSPNNYPNHVPNHYPNHNHLPTLPNHHQQHLEQQQQHQHQQQHQDQQQHHYQHQQPRKHQHSKGSQILRSDSCPPVWEKPTAAASCGRRGEGRSLTDLHQVWRGEMTREGTLPRSHHRRSTYGGTSSEGKTLPRVVSMEGGMFMGSSMEGEMPIRPSMGEGPPARGTSMEGRTLLRGASMEGGAAFVEDGQRYSSLPRGGAVSWNMGGSPPGPGFLATTTGGSCPACMPYCDSCCYCCCCPVNVEGNTRSCLTRQAEPTLPKGDSPWLPMACTDTHTSPMVCTDAHTSPMVCTDAHTSTIVCTDTHTSPMVCTDTHTLPVICANTHTSPIHAHLRCPSKHNPRPCHNPHCYQQRYHTHQEDDTDHILRRTTPV